ERRGDPLSANDHSRAFSLRPWASTVQSHLSNVYSHLLRVHSRLSRVHSHLSRVHSRLWHLHSRLSHLHSRLLRVHTMASRAHLPAPFSLVPANQPPLLGSPTAFPPPPPHIPFRPDPTWASARPVNPPQSLMPRIAAHRNGLLRDSDQPKHRTSKPKPDTNH